MLSLLRARRSAGAAAARHPASNTMLQAANAEESIKTTGVGLHTGARVELTLRPAPADTGIVFHRVDLPAPVTIPAQRDQRRRYAAVLDARAGRRVDLHRRASDVGARGSRHRQPARRRRRPRAADHGRQRRPVRVPAAIGGHRRAGGGQALSARSCTGRGARRRQVGALRSVPRLQARLHDRLSAPGVRHRRTGTSSSTSPSIRT